MQELWLDDKLVELGANKISQNYQINDLAELRDRQLSYTNSFTVPLTPSNIALMDYLGVSGSRSKRPYKRVPSKLIVDGIELMINGYAVVRSLGDKGYKINIYDGNASLYEVLKGRRMNDLNFSELNHYLNMDSYTGSFANTEGYIYCLGQFGVGYVNGIIDIINQTPAIFKHTLFKYILEEAGFTYEAEFLNDPEFLREVVIPIRGYDQIGEEETLTSKGSTTSNTLSRFDYALKDMEEFDDQFNLTDVGLSDISISGGNKLIIGVAGLYKFSISLTYSVATGNVYFYTKYNGSDGATHILPIGSSGVTDNFVFYIQAEVGDEISYWIGGNASYGTANKFEIDYTASVGGDYNSVTGGLFIDFALIMPDTSQIDFLKDIMQQYGLMFQTRRTSDHYEFIKMETLLNDRAGAEDWSDKLSSRGSSVYTIGSYAKENFMIYRYGDDEELKIVSYDGTLLADNDVISSEKTLFSSIYTISDKYGERSLEDIFAIPLWKEEDVDGVPTVKSLETAFRSFKMKMTGQTITYKFADIVGTTTIVGNIPFLSLENMDYDFYIENYYPAFRRILDEQLKRTVSLYLTPLDIYNLNFFKLKYFEEFGQYFYLNKISGFKNEKRVNVELIRALELTTNAPPNQLGSYDVSSIQHGSSRSLPLSYFVDTTPPYADLEFDQPETIKILGGLTSEITIENNGVPVLINEAIEVSSMSLRIHDAGGDPAEHTTSITFTIQSYNNPNFSDEIGSLEVTINESINLPPVADAGSNTTLVYNTAELGDGQTTVNGSGSTDPNGDALIYLWTFDSLPASIVATNTDTAIATLTGDNIPTFLSGTTITATLRVTDPLGLYDEDTTIITLIDLNEEI